MQVSTALHVSTSRIAFEGFRSVYIDSNEEKEENECDWQERLSTGYGTHLAGLGLQDSILLSRLRTIPRQRLCRTLEELGIGRPSTYAPTITTIIARRYVVKENKNLYMTELGEIVNNIMKDAFPSIVDVNFTANMESLLDSIGDGNGTLENSRRELLPGSG